MIENHIAKFIFTDRIGNVQLNEIPATKINLTSNYMCAIAI